MWLVRHHWIICKEKKQIKKDFYELLDSQNSSQADSDTFGLSGLPSPGPYTAPPHTGCGVRCKLGGHFPFMGNLFFFFFLFPFRGRGKRKAANGNIQKHCKQFLEHTIHFSPPTPPCLVKLKKVKVFIHIESNCPDCSLRRKPLSCFSYFIEKKNIYTHIQQEHLELSIQKNAIKQNREQGTPNPFAENRS